jgi:hypothetical protein
MAPSTLGTFLRAFTFGHIRQLDRVIAETIGRAWSAGAGPGGQAMTIDLDSTICEVHGKAKHGAGYGYTKVLGYHPLLATRADTGEVLFSRLRKGSATPNAARNASWRVIARVRRAGAAGVLTVRGDAGFYSGELIKILNRLGVAWSITVVEPQHSQGVAAIREDDWIDIAYPDGGQASRGDHVRHRRRLRQRAQRQVRLVTPHSAHRRRPRGCGPTGATAFITNVDLPTVAVDQFHRDHATVELAIRDQRGRRARALPSDGSSPTLPGWAVRASRTT